MAQHMGAKKIISLDASHASLPSQPLAVVALIEEAAVSNCLKNGPFRSAE
ncbi:hypothetical protein [Lysobacter sp. CFH 32150]|nr:hypothetical protein [Lysobacter sp. CFH 32150]MCI4568788.1 hypothetical protein [Lysobacter sp. CFH 32150]